MGTIADKLLKVAQTKEEIRLAIVAKGQEIDIVDAFDTYSTKIESIVSGGGSPPPKIYGVAIDENNSNPETALTYINDAIGIAPLANPNNGRVSGEWLSLFPFNQIRPCLLKNGIVQYYLDPYDYSKKIDGSAASITTAEDGDVMIEFPKIYWKFERVGTVLNVRYSSQKIDATYECLAHLSQDETEENDFIYIGAYVGSTNYIDRIYSLSGATPGSRTVEQIYAIINNSPAGYGIMSFYQTTMLKILYTVAFKNLDSTAALGYGLRSTNGFANLSSMYNASKISTSVPVKFCGIENLWSNYGSLISGILTNRYTGEIRVSRRRNYLTDAVWSYGTVIGTNNSTTNSYLKKVIGTNQAGFTPLAVGATATTYYSDWYYGFTKGSYHEKYTTIMFGGHNKDVGGIFHEMTTGITSGDYRLTYVQK